MTALDLTFAIAALILLGTALRHLGTLGRAFHVGRREDDSARLNRALEERDAVLEHLREVELDRRTGKLSEGDAERERRRLEPVAARALREVDEAQDA